MTRKKSHHLKKLINLMLVEKENYHFKSCKCRISTMNQHKTILIFISLLVMKTASQFCQESDKAPSCENLARCTCDSPVCINKEPPCPGQNNVTIIEPRFGEIPPYAFENYGPLVNLEIAGGIVNTVSSKAFRGLSNLRELSLRDNFILYINNQTLKGLNSLRSLDLSDNQIDDLEERTFSDNKMLRTLNLDRNTLNALQRNTFAGCHRLQSLRLTSNGISSIETGAFSDLGNLQELYLGDNYLAIIGANIFTGLASLQFLNLNGNFIQVFSQGSLEPLKMLHTIDVSQNKLPFIGKAFGSLRNLRSFFLNENSIEKVDDGTFTNLTYLETIELSKNRLVSWSFLDFPTPSKLKVLRLSYNKISDVLYPTSSPEPQFPKLQYLDFSGNLLQTFPAFFLKDAPLLGQPDVANNSISSKLDLRENLLACDCDYNILNDSLEQLEITCVQNASIQCGNGSVAELMPSSSDANDGVYCQISGSPLPEVIWKNPNGQIVTGYYNVSGKVTWLPSDITDVGDYMCMIYEEDEEKAGRQEIDPNSSPAKLIPALMEIMIIISTMFIVK
ncbi:insulin-like growth factor-binding protein complex acid labile subunit isoform X1 [Anneissia japonica]|uniref:insulin-like growth factor-binding protein complex acid labile subunit isoform X1 n=1 Tax=Anneissia japonica TaxID=1529436 RepID=UPI001425987C|nr:insulin-like growth factor-binding protein complex acid labile subunit isoform X1 [Anneissia japonica]